MDPEIGTPDNPLRVAIVGSGPAGAYAAGHLLGKKAPICAAVDMFDRLPTPWGLVRSGVAPDHPNIKAVTRVYEKTAAHPAFRFFGNVTFGEHVFHDDLADRYHAIIYAVGTQADKRMGIPGEERLGSHGAAEFVAWYNGHPDFRDLEFDLSKERAVVVGNGNVAMDVARILALTVDELAKTDIADHALELLEASSIREVVVLGRRGPAQAAFTNPEILEMGELTDADVIVDPGHCELDPHSRKWLEELADGTSKRNVDILREYSRRPPAGRRKRVVFEFLASPVEVVGDDWVQGVVVARNQLVPGDDGSLRAVATEERHTLDCGLLLRSIGYRGVELPGVPFDDRAGRIPNDGGRVLSDGEPVAGEYVTGWIKRGPSGVIGTNKKDAQETANLLFADVAAGRTLTPSRPGPEAVDELLAQRAPEAVSYDAWQLIDAAEKAAGEPQGRPRVKLTRVPDLLEAAGIPQPAER
jgi:ferredoxin--NADP+ reductase